MLKKTHLKIKYHDREKTVVKKGDHVTSGMILVETVDKNTTEFNLAKLLRVDPKKISKYLTVKEGDKLETGAVIAQKKGLLSKKLIKTPISGIFHVRGDNSGLVEIRSENQSDTVKAWCDGTVFDIDKDTIDVEVDAHCILGKSGQGRPVKGKLKVINHEVDVLSLPLDIDQSILALKHADEAVIAKANALGAVAIIAQILEQPPLSVPYLELAEFDDILPYDHYETLVYGDEKHLLIFSPDKHDKSNHK